MRILVATRLLLPVVLVVAVAAVGLAVNAGATSAKAVPFCKTGQKSTKANPYKTVPWCKTGQKSTKAKPCKTLVHPYCACRFSASRRAGMAVSSRSRGRP